MNTQKQIWTIEDVQDFLSVCRTTVYNLLKKDPHFPKPIRLGGLIRFRSDDFYRYVSKKAEVGVK